MCSKRGNKKISMPTIINKDIRIDFNSLGSKEDFVIEENQELNLAFNKVSGEHEIVIEVKDNSILHLSLLADSSVKYLNFVANLGLNSKLIVYYADFSLDLNKTNVSINLNKENAEVTWKLASLSSKSDKKEIVVSVFHNAPSTFARVDNYGVAKDTSKLLFAGTSHILNGMVKSKTQQNAKIMVFDNDCIATCKPILKIDENDIEASHAAAVGKISDDHIFYLTSRGLTLEESKMIITLGYLKPIFKGFNEEDVAYMNDIMGGRL